MTPVSATGSVIGVCLCRPDRECVWCWANRMHVMMLRRLRYPAAAPSATPTEDDDV
jgi:hypothetical protein